MKKTIIASLVGALLMFCWQFLSWGPLQLHRSAQEYTPKQDSIMAYLNSQFSSDGSYFMPTFPKKATSEDMNKLMKNSVGKPWAIIHFHKAYNANMGMNMARGFLVNIVVLWLLCWLIGKINIATFGTIFAATLFVGLIGFLNITYTFHIWYLTSDLNAHFIDTIVSWAVVGVWLGFYLKKK
ncbi:MAG TPA: hypothetical protein VHP12_02750 [Chitinophagaceae bacterium]|nr:hypothetical protein [Chitinophagaceae bacterium]